jgi:hypothetical protein
MAVLSAVHDHSYADTASGLVWDRAINLNRFDLR